MELYRSLPPEAVQILLVLFLSFMVGLEREEHKATAGHYSFGGVRTFPLIGLIGYSMALLSGTRLVPVTLGFLVIAAFLLLSYWHKLSASVAAGVTTEMSGLTTYLVGALVYYGHFWIATALSVASLLLLELKVVLEDLAGRVPRGRDSSLPSFCCCQLSFCEFYPIVNSAPSHINPFKTWLVVVAVERHLRTGTCCRRWPRAEVESCWPLCWEGRTPPP